MYVWTLAKAVDRLNGPKYKAKKIFTTVGTTPTRKRSSANVRRFAASMSALKSTVQRGG